MSNKVAEYLVQIAIQSNGDLTLYIVEDREKIVAEQTMAQSSCLSDFHHRVGTSTDIVDEISKIIADGGSHHDLFAADDAIFSLYEGLQKEPHGLIIEKACDWLTEEVLPDYDRPDLQTADDRIVIYADGERVNRRKSTSASGRRPKSSSRKLNDIWF